MGMPASVSQMGKAIWCVCVSTTLLARTANIAPRSTGTDHGLVPLQTLPIIVFVSTDTFYIIILMYDQGLKAANYKNKVIVHGNLSFATTISWHWSKIRKQILSRIQQIHDVIIMLDIKSCTEKAARYT